MSVQQERKPGTALDVGYYRTWFRNLTVINNLAVTAADFSHYCVTTPPDSRLPGGGGQRLCGLCSVNQAKFSQATR